MTESEGGTYPGEPMPRSGVRGFSPAALRKARADAELRADELARLIGVTRQAVSSWENGRSRPSPVTLLALAKALRVSTADLAPIRERDLRIGDLRSQAGLTQAHVADALGVSTTVIGDLERGFRPMDTNQADVLAELYQVDAARVRTIWQQTYDAVTTRLASRK